MGNAARMQDVINGGHYPYRPVHREEDICPTCTNEREITMWEEHKRDILDVLWPCPASMEQEYHYITLLDRVADGSYASSGGMHRIVNVLNANATLADPVYSTEQVDTLTGLLNIFVSNMTLDPRFSRHNSLPDITDEDGAVWRWLTDGTRSRVLVALATT